MADNEELYCYNCDNTTECFKKQILYKLNLSYTEIFFYSGAMFCCTCGDEVYNEEVHKEVLRDARSEIEKKIDCT